MTIWMCPCLKPHTVLLADTIPGGRYRGYCTWSRQSIELIKLCREDKSPREYEPKRRKVRR
jgi:hypothetical protein